MKKLVIAITATSLLVGLGLFLSGCGGSGGNLRTDAKGIPIPEFDLKYLGNEILIDYEKYGYFRDEGTENYRYIITNSMGLAKAAGVGIYPNIEYIKDEPRWDAMKNSGYVVGGKHWEKKPDTETQFYSWATAWEDWGVRQFFVGMALREAGYIQQAIKAFYSVVVHFHRSAAWAPDGKSVWYVAPAAISQLNILTLRYPQLGITYTGGSFSIQNGDDTDLSNDIIVHSPGRLHSNMVGMVQGKMPERHTYVETRDFAVRAQPLKLNTPGQNAMIDYTKYGRFEGIMESGKYKYVITDTAGLAKAVGEGIYPNTTDLAKNPQFQAMKEAGWLRDNHWKMVDFDYPTSMFYAWANAADDPGVKLFYMGEALREAGEKQNDPTLLMHALKAYHAVLIHFPGSPVYAPDGSYLWYVSKAAINKAYYICRTYPKLGVDFVDPFVLIKNEYDLDITNDIHTINPGRMIRARKKVRPDLSKLKVVEQRGKGKVQLRKYSNGHWQMFVDNKPFVVKAVTYDPTKIGESPHDGSLRNWQFTDDNNSGRADSPYDSWVDKNRNNIQDPDEPTVGDFYLLQKMGANAIRFYHKPYENREYRSEYAFDKNLMRDMFNTYGLRAIVGDFLGAYTVGSGADWDVGTDYRDPAQRKMMKDIVRGLVTDHKGEDYILMYLLGNENNMNNAYGGVNATKTLAAVYPEAYTSFLTEVAEMIKEIDPDHPVAVGNLETQLIEYYEQYAYAIDILGVNSYRGKEGFGDLYDYVRHLFDRPVLITEYGSDILDLRRDSVIYDEQSQADYHRGTWGDIAYNLAGGYGAGNSIGGVIFEWLDEWWKSPQGPKDIHDEVRDSPMAFQDGWSSEEWLGIMGQGLGDHSPYLRQPRKAYYLYKNELWNKEYFK